MRYFTDDDVNVRLKRPNDPVIQRPGNPTTWCPGVPASRRRFRKGAAAAFLHIFYTQSFSN